MNYIELMVDEHRNIKRMLAVIRRYCYKVLNNDELNYEDFFSMIEFVRNYADKHHHGKEEKLLFTRMTEKLGPAAEKLVKNGMLVEHDLGRLHIQELEAAVHRVIAGDDEARLDVIANAISYANLLYRHIDKEDNVVYKYAQNNLSKDVQESIEKECALFEEAASADHIQKKYLDMIAKFE